MAVDTVRVNEILSDVNQRVKVLIEDADLADAMGSSTLDPIQRIVNEFTTLVTDSFPLPDTSEGMLQAEADDAINQASLIINQISSKRSSHLAGMLSGIGAIAPADSPVWNELISTTGGEVDRIARVYGDQVANMPKALRNRLDTDLAKVLDSISQSFKNDPSPNNADRVRKQVTNALMIIEKELESALKATLSASIQSLASQKMTKLQELEMGLVGAERGMEKGQRQMWRTIAQETKALIVGLTQSNYLVYDKVVRAQKLKAIDQKLGLLDNIRVNASTKMNTLDGFFGHTGHRTSRKTYSAGSSLGSGYVQPNVTPRSAFKRTPPGFAGFAGFNGGDGDFF